MDGTILATGIDTLVIGYGITEYTVPGLLEGLSEAKTLAQATQYATTPVPYPINGITFNVQPRGARSYAYIVANEDLNMRIAEKTYGGAKMPEVYIRYSSSFLWKHGYKNATLMIEEWLRSWANINGVTVSQVDLCTDLELPFPELLVKRQVLCKAHNRVNHDNLVPVGIHMTDHTQEGYQFGTGDVVCRLYDKTREIIKSGKIWMRDVWTGGGWDGETDVTRFEAQLRRGYLRKLEVSSMEDLDRTIPGIWDDITNGWIRMTEVSEQHNKNRWPTLPWWETIRAARSRYGMDSGERPLKRHNPQYEQLIAQAVGCMRSAVALKASETGQLQAAFDEVLRTVSLAMCEPDSKTAIIRRLGKSSRVEDITTPLLEAVLEMGGVII